MFAAIAGNQGAEHFVVGIVFLLLFSLKYTLRKKAQMHCKAAEIQRIPVKMAVVEALHHLHAAVHKAGDIVHHAHGGVELRIDDVQGDEAALVIREICPAALADDRQTVHAKTVLLRIELPDRCHERVGEADALLTALDGKTDMVGQRDEHALVQRVIHPAADHLHQLVGEQQMLIGDLFQQLHQLLLHGRAGHAVAALHLSGVQLVPRLCAKAQPAPGDDQLAAGGVHHPQDVVVDRFFDGILHCFSSSS